MKKHLITGGCSFTETVTAQTKTWPLWLKEELNCELHNTAMGSQGNGLISRKIIRYISDNFKSIDTSELLVGIMWSGPSRHDFFSEEIEFHLQDGVSDGWIENPTQVVPHSGKQNKGWIICNHGWKTNASEIYYRYFYNRIGQIVYTLEHILRTQWFLDRLNIDYFMTTYTSEVLPPDVLENPEVKHLWSLVDKQKFLPIDGCYEWCRDNTEIMFRRHDNHPLTEHHELFVKKFLKPHLKSLGLL